MCGFPAVFENRTRVICGRYIPTTILRESAACRGVPTTAEKAAAAAAAQPPEVIHRHRAATGLPRRRYRMLCDLEYRCTKHGLVLRAYVITRARTGIIIWIHYTRSGCVSVRYCISSKRIKKIANDDVWEWFPTGFKLLVIIIFRESFDLTRRDRRRRTSHARAYRIFAVCALCVCIITSRFAILAKDSA